MHFKRLPLLAAACLLAGCQTNYNYVRTGYGPEFNVAQAQCEIMAMGVGNNIVAWGSPGYVAGAELGNAINNAIMQDQFIQRCMIIKGWSRVPTTTSGAQAKMRAKKP